jgi:hypothetical protein
MADDESRDETAPAVPDEPGPPVDPWASQAPMVPSPAHDDEPPPPDTPTLGALDETVVGSPEDGKGPEPVKPHLGPSGTGILPAVGDGAPAPAPRWSARAQVRSPEPDEAPSGQDDWDGQDAEPSRGLVMPVIIGLAVILLLAVTGIGLWLILRDKNAGTVPPIVSTSAGTTATSAPVATRPQTVTTQPAATTPALQTVPIPDVSGKDYASAAAQLQGLGLQVTRSDQLSKTVPAGRVIETNPAVGTVVLPGETVTIVVSSGSPRETTPPASPTPVRTPTPTPTR